MVFLPSLRWLVREERRVDYCLDGFPKGSRTTRCLFGFTGLRKQQTQRGVHHGG